MIRKEHITHCKPYYVIMRCEIIHITPPAKAKKLFTCEHNLVFFIILRTYTHVRVCVCVSMVPISNDTRRREGSDAFTLPYPLFEIAIRMRIWGIMGRVCVL